jgi:hypothetical protein
MKTIQVHGNDVIGAGMIEAYVAEDGPGVISPVGFRFIPTGEDQGNHKGFNMSIQEARRLAAFIVVNT